QLLELDRMAQKSASKLLKAIEQSKDMPLESLIYALGIRFVGQTVARDLANAFGSMDKLINADEAQIADIDAIGPTIAESVATFFYYTHLSVLVTGFDSSFLTFEAEVRYLISHKLEEITFVLTGSLPSMTRKDATHIIEDHGGNVTSSVNGNTYYLLAGDSP